ncbi:erythromycin esterase family protein [Haloactinomyces albus]|uniref:Erythromycin esterase-like protein n=1 Tax=Haloactinomyces albus TaxID=1352928 RepID=A0AAE3ZI01_9ACTN|nr:erythromycin esterase family protein [Haloactinomyces albus]MDR7304025.1 erythromycin esterase-like protein [Haloactinomyces albus]
MPTNPIRDVAVPLHTLDPAEPDVSDLAALRDLVGNARVVCLGESAHGVSEFCRIKDRVLRFLVSELGFSALVMESGFPEGLAVNDWVLGGAGDLERIAEAGITYGFGACAQMRAGLQWMRDRNAQHESKVRFYGMDIPGSCANPGPAVEACLARLAPRPQDQALRALADLGERFQAHARYRAMTPGDRARLSHGIAELVERAGTSGDDIAYRCALGAQLLDGHLGEGHNPREELMADTVRWILDREERIVISAHNGHVQRGLTPIGAPALGRILAPVLGDDMVVIGTTRACGEIPELHFEGEPPRPSSISLEEVPPPPPHTIDALMDAVDFPLHLANLRRVPPERIAAATAICAQTLMLDLDPSRAFDALVHVRRLTPAPEIFESLQDSIARATENAGNQDPSSPC